MTSSYFKSPSRPLGVVEHSCTPALGKLKQEGHEFEASPDDTVRSKVKSHPGVTSLFHKEESCGSRSPAGCQDSAFFCKHPIFLIFCTRIKLEPCACEAGSEWNH